MTLVLGMAISVAALRHMLPVKAADLLQAREFRLVQVRGQLQTSPETVAHVAAAQSTSSCRNCTLHVLFSGGLRDAESMVTGSPGDALVWCLEKIVAVWAPPSVSFGCHWIELHVALCNCQAKPMLESVVREVLLGSRFHGLIFDHAILDFLTHHFLNHDFNVSFVKRGLQVHPFLSPWPSPSPLSKSAAMQQNESDT